MRKERVKRRAVGPWSVDAEGVPNLTKRLMIGRPLRNERLDDTLLRKALALPVFCSDPLSSVAYATEEILLVLALGGTALLHLTWWVAVAVALLLVIVVASYRQTCYAYPNGGGAYAVSKANLGTNAALVAASALLVDYVLTVAVSVVAGVANVVSAFPSLGPHAVGISIGLIVLLALVNLRGIKESGTAFAIPTYGFVVSVLVLVGTAAFRAATGHHLRAESAGYTIHATHQTAGIAVLFLAMRAFASGCTALTGVEAISNGVPNFRPPKSRNAADTLAIMGFLAIVMFMSISALALVAHVHITENTSNLVGAPAGYEQRTVIAQLAAVAFGSGPGFYIVQAFTALILVLAANTAFNGFPILASLLGNDGFLPRQFARRGDRLVFSNGIVLLAAIASVLVWAFNASTTRLIQLYIIGVFISFTLSQAGMVVHWRRELRRPNAKVAQIRRSLAINAVGAIFTGLVLVIELVFKFQKGAWIVVIAMPIVFVLMREIRKHYDHVAEELAPGPEGVPLPSRVHVIVLVSKIHTPTLQALAFARATQPNTITALNVTSNQEQAKALADEWVERGIPVPLTFLNSPFRDITKPVLEYVNQLRQNGPRDVVSVFIPEYVVGRWWENILHNQSALRLKARLLFQPRVMVTSVPWQLQSSEEPREPRVGAPH